MLRQGGFDQWTEYGGDGGSEQPSNACRQLKGPALTRRGGGLFLGNPNQEVDAISEDLGEGVRRQVGGVPALRENPGGQTGRLLEGLIRDTVGPRRAPVGLEHEAKELAFKGFRFPREGGNGSPVEVHVEQPPGFGGEGWA